MNKAVEALTHGLRDGGVSNVYNFPGFMSHEIAGAFGPYKISLNERVAYAEAFGSSLAGSRTLVTFKNVGLNIASDAFLHSITAGVGAGLVLVVTDDILVRGSQESQDSRHYFDFCGGLWLEPGNLQQAYDFARQSFELSETYDVPVVIRMPNAIFDQTGQFVPSIQKADPKTKQRSTISPKKYVVHPYYYKHQKASLSIRREKILAWSNQYVTPPKTKHTKGVIHFGAAHFDDIPTDVDVLHIHALPLPVSVLSDFIAAHDDIVVLEQGDAYVIEKVKALTSSKHTYSSLAGPRSVETTFVKWSAYEKFFAALSGIKNQSIVVSDITQFTVETYDTVNTALSLGVSVSTAIGLCEGGDNYVYTLAGDCSFLHEGIGIITEALNRNITMSIIIFDNHASWCTGGQEPIGDINAIPDHKNLQKFYLNYEKDSEDTIAQTLKQMRQFPGISVLFLAIPLGDLVRRT